MVSNGLFKLVFMVVLAAIVMSSYAQQPKKNSSYSELKSRSSKEDMSDEISKAAALRSSSPQQSLELLKDALAVSILRQDFISESKCYNLIGNINMDIQEWKLALENFQNANRILADKKLTVNPEYKISLFGLAAANLQLRQFKESLDSYEQLKKQRLTEEEKARVDIGISEVYYQMGNYKEALNTVGETSDRKANKPSVEGQYDNQRAKIYARENRLEESKRSLQAGQSKTPADADVENQAPAQPLSSAKDEVVEVLQEQGRYDDKIDVLNSSIEFNRNNNNFGEVSKDKLELGKTLLAKGETSAAIRELEEAAMIADTTGDPERQANAYLSLAELHEKYGNNAMAIRTYKKYSDAVEKSREKRERILTENATIIKSQRDIEEVSKYVAISKQEEQLAQATVFRQKLIIYGLMLILMIVGVTSYFIYKNAVASKTANQLLALKSLRSQMNPHFIFNALNSVNHFVSQNDERTANRFLSEFSRLMRLVLENSQEDFIPLSKEEEIITLYAKLEHYRFRDKFDYEIVTDHEINKEAILIPPMLIQPYIENAVWHGLRYRETKGFLSVHFLQGDGILKVMITDNGIGRVRSEELKTENQRKHQSTGLKNIRERLAIINKVYKANYRVTIDDLPENGGTCVTLYVPSNLKG